jgi:membrane fusion protein, multidrug efflux system
VAAPADAGETRISVVALRSRAAPLDRAVMVRGETEAAREVEVRAETSGQVISTPLRKGASVAEGELLCEIDPGTREVQLVEAEARLLQARAGIPEAEARVTEARARLEEAEIADRAATQLVEQGFASQTRVAGARAGVESARAGVQSALAGLEAAQAAVRAGEAAVAAARNELAKLRITAPFAGLLESDAAEIGSLLQPGALCATVIQLDPIKLVGFVPETAIDRIARRARRAGGSRTAARSWAGSPSSAVRPIPRPAPSGSRSRCRTPTSDPRRPDGRDRRSPPTERMRISCRNPRSR